MEEVVSNEASNNSHQVEKDLEWGLANVKNVATSRCMYKVPQILYDANKEAYTPKVISIGPYHCRRKDLYVSHSLKLRYLQSFLDRTGSKLATCVEMAKGWEEKVRGYYDDKEECGRLNSAEFLQMILLDGIFIVEFTWQWSNENTIQGSADLLLEEASLKDDIIRDLTLLENQLPFFVLQELGDHSYPPGDGDGDGDDHLWMSYLTKLFVGHFDLMPLSDSNRLQESLMRNLGRSDIMHLVDFMHEIICTIFSISQVRSRPKLVHFTSIKTFTTLKSKFRPVTEPVTFLGPRLELSRSATELHQAGVQLRCAPNLILPDIALKENGLLQIPPIVVKRNTESLFRNIIAYEQCRRRGNIFRSYVILMDCLINTSHDVQLLVDSEIIHNSLGETEDVCTLFNNLYKMPMMDSRDFHFAELCKGLNGYSRDPWHKWKARCFRWRLIFRRDYISSPWSIVSVIAAFILLLLTTMQTICSIKGVKW